MVDAIAFYAKSPAKPRAKSQESSPHPTPYMTPLWLQRSKPYSIQGELRLHSLRTDSPKRIAMPSPDRNDSRAFGGTGSGMKFFLPGGRMFEVKEEALGLPLRIKL